MASLSENLRADILVDQAPYQMSNICGALVPESVAVLRALAAGHPPDEVREQALDGRLLHQRSWHTRRRFWHAIHARYLGHGVRWVSADLARSSRLGPQDPTALGLLYLHFAMRDHLTRDWLLGPVWDRWAANQRRLTREDVLSDLSNLGVPERWKEGSRKKLATSLLSSLRDYGLADGVQVKHLRRPVLTDEVAAHLVRLLIEQGVRGAAVVEHAYWHLFFRTSDDAAAELAALALHRVLRFERAGSTVVLETPWSEA